MDVSNAIPRIRKETALAF